jgi:hypothetical protein
MYERPRQLPGEIVQRYPWLPKACRELLTETKAAVSPSNTAWLNLGGSAFAWNEWERLSLKAAADDRALSSRIIRFWDDHFPLLMSVKSGYAYFAIEKTRLQIVRGEEPEFEGTHVLDGTIPGVLGLFATSDKLERWI